MRGNFWHPMERREPEDTISCTGTAAAVPAYRRTEGSDAGFHDHKWQSRRTHQGILIYIRRHERCFLGWYVDVSALKAEQKYDIKLDLPELMPGQFQGLFVENIETRRTGAIK